MRILIDNGHGENTPGKRSPDGKLREWEYTRRIADMVIIGLRNKGIDAERIVKEMVDIPLSVRCRRANTIYRETGGNAILVSMPQGWVRIGCLHMDGVYLYPTMLR